MQRHQLKHVALAAMLGFAALWPTIATATQTSLNFNQSWMILGPYYMKEDVSTANSFSDPNQANQDRDYMTDGLIYDQAFIPTTGTVVNTNFALPQCGSYQFVWRCRSNGFSVPTIFAFTVPGSAPRPESVDVRGQNSGMNGANSVFDQGRNYDAVTNPQTNSRLNDCMIYAWAYANNLTGAPITDARIGSAQDDRMVVWVNGIRRHNAGGGGTGTTNRVHSVSGPFSLPTGPNLVMAKVFNGTGSYRFQLKMQTSGATNNGPTPGFRPRRFAGTSPRRDIQSRLCRCRRIRRRPIVSSMLRWDAWSANR